MTKETKMAGGGADTAELMAVFAAYTEANDARLAEIEAKGDSDPLTDERLARIDRRLEALSLKMARPEAGAVKTADEDATSIFVKGLDFGTVEKKLRAHFVAAAERVSGRVLSARVVTHRGPGGKLLSRGFGFVEFDQHIVAKSVLNALQGSSLDGKTLKLELSSQGGARASAERRGGGGGGRVERSQL